MASSFGLFNTAYSGLAAARAALEVTGENVANVNTPGYTRQRVQQVSQAGMDLGVQTTTGLNIGQGTKVTGIARLTDAVVDARVRDTASSDGYWSAASSALSTVETSLAEPGDSGLSTSLSNFWTAWQGVGSTTNSGGGGQTVLLGAAQALTSRIASGYADASNAWSGGLTAAQGSVAQINNAGTAVATLNDQILRIENAGGNANELKDQRDTAITTLASLAGATTRQNTNGSIDVIIGGSTFVSGTSSRSLAVDAPPSMSGLSAQAVTLKFADRDQGVVQPAGGALAAQLNALAPAASGGIYASTAAAYDAVATQLTTQVNAVYQAGASSSGGAVPPFFRVAASGSAAASLTVVPTSGDQVVTGKPGQGAYDTSNADAIAQLGTAAGAPDRGWASFVAGIGAKSQATTAQATVASSAATAAKTTQTSQNGVDLDEETANLVVFQHAYQGAARVLTTIDQMLDTLINHTGVVGIS